MPKPTAAAASELAYRDAITQVDKLSEELKQEIKNIIRWVGTGVKHPIPPGPKSDAMLEGLGKVIFATHTLVEGIKVLRRVQ